MADYSYGENRFYGQYDLLCSTKVVANGLPWGRRQFRNCTIECEMAARKGTKPHLLVVDSTGQRVLDVSAQVRTLYGILSSHSGERITSLSLDNSNAHGDSSLRVCFELAPRQSTVRDLARVFLDVETTGLSPSGDEILQLAMVDGRGNTLWDRTYNPSVVKSWPEAERIHHIRPVDVADCPSIDEDLMQIQSILDRAERVYAFNAPFDFAFLGMLGLRIDRRRGFDTMRLYARKFHQRDFIKLTEAAKEVHYHYRPHDALTDCLAALQVQNKVDGGVGRLTREYVKPEQRLVSAVQRARDYAEAHQASQQSPRPPVPQSHANPAYSLPVAQPHAIPAQRPPLVQPQAPAVQHPPVAQHNAATGQRPKGFYVWFTILAVLEGILILCTFAAPQLAIVSLPAAWLIWHLWRSYGRWPKSNAAQPPETPSC